jgi:3-dehydroquinate synthase
MMTEGNDRITSELRVPFRYGVYFTEHMFDVANSVFADVLRQGHGRSAEKVLVVIEKAIAQARPAISTEIQAYLRECVPEVTSDIAPMFVAGGEDAKNDTTAVREILEAINAHKLSRHSYVIGVGGGALLDVVGFAAAIAHRGIRHIRIPTTTLSQADGGIGVKNGINAFGKKNFVGTFAPPYAVINDSDFLQLLPGARRSAGYVEAVKVALIRDADFFEQIERSADDLNAYQLDAMRSLVRRSAELHMRHISEGGDPFEFGSARPLDFGHWAAHKLEQLSHFEIGHAEAVAIGMAIDVVYSRESGNLPAAQAERILTLLTKLRFRLFAEELDRRNSDGELTILSGLDEFREHLGGELTITLLRDIGSSTEVHEINRTLVSRAIDELRERDLQRPR